MSEPLLTLPRTYDVVIKESSLDPDGLVIEQSDSEITQVVFVHRSQVAAIIRTLQAFLDV